MLFARRHLSPNDHAAKENAIIPPLRPLTNNPLSVPICKTQCAKLKPGPRQPASRTTGGTTTSKCFRRDARRTLVVLALGQLSTALHRMRWVDEQGGQVYQQFRRTGVTRFGSCRCHSIGSMGMGHSKANPGKCVTRFGSGGVARSDRLCATRVRHRVGPIESHRRGQIESNHFAGIVGKLAPTFHRLDRVTPAEPHRVTPFRRICL